MNQTELLKQNNYLLSRWTLDLTTLNAEVFATIGIKQDNQIVIVASEKYNIEQLAKVLGHLAQVLRNNQPNQIIEFKP